MSQQHTIVTTDIRELNTPPLISRVFAYLHTSELLQCFNTKLHLFLWGKQFHNSEKTQESTEQEPPGEDLCNLMWKILSTSFLLRWNQSKWTGKWPQASYFMQLWDHLLSVVDMQSPEFKSKHLLDNLPCPRSVTTG